MREIKFRAWDTENKTMIKWSDLHSKVMFFNYIENSRYLVMQYTGLKDKNGKEIYEGDVVDCIASERFSEDSGIRYINFIQDYDYGFVVAEKGCVHGLPLGWYESLEVIGNIYENPELLKTHE